jgi:hypothetical protein
MQAVVTPSTAGQSDASAQGTVHIRRGAFAVGMQATPSRHRDGGFQGVSVFSPQSP